MYTVNNRSTGADTGTGNTDDLVRQDFDVIGMTCGHCEQAVGAEVGRLPGVIAVAVDATTGMVTLESTRNLDRAEVVAAVEEAGYEVAR